MAQGKWLQLEGSFNLPHRVDVPHFKGAGFSPCQAVFVWVGREEVQTSLVKWILKAEDSSAEKRAAEDLEPPILPAVGGRAAPGGQRSGWSNNSIHLLLFVSLPFQLPAFTLCSRASLLSETISGPRCPEDTLAIFYYSHLFYFQSLSHGSCYSPWKNNPPCPAHVS